MSGETEARKKYLAGYEAFQQGDFSRANELADSCMAMSSKASYWYAGALGLKCWVANFSNNLVDLEQTAASLLALDTGSDKPWFDGLALLNLGLARRKNGNTRTASTLLSRAAERYGEQQLQLEQPREWQYVLDYFNALCRWAVAEEATIWEEILDRLEKDGNDKQSELLRELTLSARLMLRYSQGKEVKGEAVTLVQTGTSRTFLAVLLIE